MYICENIFLSTSTQWKKSYYHFSSFLTSVACDLLKQFNRTSIWFKHFFELLETKKP